VRNGEFSYSFFFVVEGGAGEEFAEKGRKILKLLLYPLIIPIITQRGIECIEKGEDRTGRSGFLIQEEKRGERAADRN